VQVARVDSISIAYAMDCAAGRGSMLPSGRHRASSWPAPLARCWSRQATVAQIREPLVAAGAATDEEVDQHLANVATGPLDLATSLMISAWGASQPGALTNQ
jgi:hypothetical protein